MSSIAAPKKRKHELSLMNIVLCLLVIFIHASSYTVSNADRSSWVFAVVSTAWRLSACAVYGFIFLSGVKLALGADRDGFSYPRYILSRVTRVWLPYAAATAVYYAYFIWQGYMSFSASDFVRMLLDGNMSSHFYFVIVIMQFYLLAPLWRRLIKRLASPEWIVITLAVSLLVGQLLGQYLPDTIRLILPDYHYPYADRTFTFYIFWWMLGIIVGRNYERVTEFVKCSLRPITVLFVCVTIPNILLGYIHLTGRANVYWLETMHILYVFTAVMLLFALSVRLGETGIAALALPMRIDRASFSIYLWHPLALYFANQLLAYFTVPLSVRFAAHLAFAFIGTIAVCIGVQLIGERVRRVRAK